MAAADAGDAVVPDQMTGTLYGIGLGPGDPELMTLKAHRLISAAKVIAYPAPDHGVSFARSIAADLIPAAITEIPIVIPMRSERIPAQKVYDAAALQIAKHLDAGHDVIVLCEGDPFFYGSFMYLHSRLAQKYACVVVPGITSISAGAAASGIPLSARNDVLSVIPAPLPEADIAARLAVADAAVLVKLGRHLPKLRRLIAAAGLTERATFLVNISLPEQMVIPLADAPETAPYFSMILIAGTDPYATS